MTQPHQPVPGPGPASLFLGLFATLIAMAWYLVVLVRRWCWVRRVAAGNTRRPDVTSIPPPYPGHCRGPSSAPASLIPGPCTRLHTKPFQTSVRPQPRGSVLSPSRALELLPALHRHVRQYWIGVELFIFTIVLPGGGGTWRRVAQQLRRYNTKKYD